MKAKGIICMANPDCMWGLVIAPPEASGCAEQQSGRRLSSSGFTVSVPTSQPWGGSENKKAEEREGEGYTDSSFTQNISPTAHCLKDKGSECFMPDGKQRQQFKTICIQHMHTSPSTSPFLCPDWYWNIIHLERRHVIIFLPGLLLLPLRSGQFQVVAGWTGMFRRNKSDWTLRFDSV